MMSTHANDWPQRVSRVNNGAAVACGQRDDKRPEEHGGHRLHVDELDQDDRLGSAYRSKTVNA